VKVYIFTNEWTGECPIICSQDYSIIAQTYPFSIQFLHQTIDSFGLSITLFEKYSWNGIFCEPYTIHVTSTLFMLRSKSCKSVLFWGTNAYSIHWQIHFHNYKRHSRTFNIFNKGNIEYIYLWLSKMTSHSDVFLIFSIKAVAYLSMWDASGASF